MSDHHGFEQSLLHNGLDFILEGMIKLGEDNVRSKKYALLNIYSGFLLVMKELLRREHWSLLFNKRKEPNFKDFQNGDFESIGIKDTISRLKNVIGLELTKEFEFELEKIRKIRNRIEHFEFSESSTVFESLSVKAVIEVLEFISEHIDTEEILENEKQALQKIREQLGVNIRLVEENTKRANLEVRNGQLLLTCYLCDQKFLEVENGAYCYFCHEKNDDPNDAANLYFNKHSAYMDYHPKHNPVVEDSYIDCPSCGFETCVVDEDSLYSCFTCGGSSRDGRWDKCSHCQRMFCPEEQEMICNFCFEEKMAHD
ncbi:hypothetical protein DAY19_08545 [Halobacteriovorax vibrionivorans]|uniref:Uncharacterized protein n=1 Tax=Halobacteriovorax vibrionivorans TaxID=2152716 RepID=A0ABY0IFL6_9BACT|nr:MULTISPECIES: hypothetical protein [Halobacteriovorax]RZF21728.1 hypothetical protein DAY19_08545 [Halobacteriovorax vibrionivorans]TGD45651.1 hypothetical protein EP118_15085 [Halobacteriovorax sp. Y22]